MANKIIVTELAHLVAVYASDEFTQSKYTWIVSQQTGYGCNTFLSLHLDYRQNYKHFRDYKWEKIEIKFENLESGSIQLTDVSVFITYL